MAKKRPYSTQFTAHENPQRYLLSGIPPTLWTRARTRAAREGLALRTVILSLVKQWTDRPEGHLLVMKKRVLQCNTCGAVIAAS